MVVFAVVCAVLALVLLMLLLQARAAAGSTRDALVAAERQRDTERGRAAALDDEIADLESELETALALVVEAETARDDAEQRATAAETRIGELETELDEAVQARGDAERKLSDTTGELTEAHVALEERSAEAEARAAEVLDLTHQNEQLQVDLVEAADQAARQRAPSVPSVLVSDDGAGLDVPGFSPTMAWQLELVRSERTWRYSVAANPIDDPDPFESADNPLRLAIEIEALALREDVGAFIGIDWQAGKAIDPTEDPARAHLTLRLAQELLAAAAREMSPSTLVVRPDPARSGVSLEVIASDPEDVDFKIPPPPIASEWIGIDEHGGMVVTVKLDEVRP